MKTYTVKELAELSGVTPRTLRHYDKIGLLVPIRKGSGEYREYTAEEVDRLQEILLYKELGVELSEIKVFLESPRELRETRLEIHLKRLNERKKTISTLIKNVEDTIKAEKGGTMMKDEKKFQGLKKDMVGENERKYGEEIRKKYGDNTIDESNDMMMNMNKQDFEDMKKLAEEINQKLEEAVQGDIKPSDDEAIEIAEMHKKWLNYTWPSYDPQAHVGVTEMYVTDDRFRKFYDANVEGCAYFLSMAVKNMVSKKYSER